MLRRTLRCRAGFSLVEVLVALFIVAAGLIALLSLFPLGAVQMGQALRDDRSQQIALQADGKIRELWRKQVLETIPADEYFIGTDPYYSVLNYYDDSDGAATTVNGTQPAIGRAHKTSYPVLIDPIGSVSYPSKAQRVAQTYGGLFLRRNLPTTVTLPTAIRFATMPDDMEFASDGKPADKDGLTMADSSTGQIFRAGRYNWAAVIQRPDNVNRLVADLKILVFDRRPPGVDADNELRYSLTNVAAGDTRILFPAGNDMLGLRVGSWIMDGTLGGGDSNGDGIQDIRNANFYRVTAVDDSNTASTLVELHIPIVRPRGEANPTAAYAANFYIFRELIDVYDRPQLAPSGYQKQTP